MTLSQAHETLARCGNKIEMFVIREDLLSPRKGKEPPVVKAVVHNPYNSPLSLYSTENIAETLAKQTEVLTEGQVSEEDEGPENLSFKQKSAVFQLLEEQAKQEGASKSRGSQQSATVTKPKTAPPPPPPKPKPPSSEYLYNGYDSDRQIQQQQQVYQDQQKTSRVEYQTTQRVVSQQHQYQQERPVQYQQTTTYQTSAFQKSPGYHSPSADNYQQQVYHSQVNSYQQSPGYQQSVKTYQQTHQQINQSNQQQYPGYQSPTTTTFQPLNQINYQQSQSNPSRGQTHQGTQHQTNYQTQTHQSNYQPQKTEQPTTAVSKAVFKIGPPPPPRGSSAKQQDSGDMAAVYRQQYEQHLQQQYEQQQMYMNNYDDYESTKPKAHIINENIFEHNSTSGTPITYKAPPAAPPKPHWPPPPQNDQFRSPAPPSPSGMRNVASVWPPKKSTVTELPKTGFNPAAVREQGTGRRCIWPPPKPEDEMRSGRNTPQSPMTGRRIQWNPSPSPPLSRRTVFSTSQSPVRRKDLQWPPPSPTSFHDKENVPRFSPKTTRKARFDDYIKEHASINVPQTYRPPPGTQHVEYR
ncbi:transcription factor SPT20 homolog isoform X1 [Stegodyphus dumicola]|uniref:transcription factor SPT20 homolog isoform X1 n=1 Tax=Stegodyphus dumicola TaxID=202533 RepID=UPI0015AA7EDB|nr:transcription factor SPT20 homolog isoform X1 [Stegodyphus dumicola]